MIARQTLPCFVAEETVIDQAHEVIPLELVFVSEFENWLRQQETSTINWLMSHNFKLKEYSYCVIPAATGKIKKVLVGVAEPIHLWSIAHLPHSLPVGFYSLDPALESQWTELALGWGLAAYQYNVYKTSERTAATLVIPENQSAASVQSQLQAIYLIRDLINTPTEDMGPEQLSFAAQSLAQFYGANFVEIVGDDLLKANYPAIHTVGRASSREPRLLDLTWGDESHPKLTLVGKGVCFDTGGLDIKNIAAMQLMKKDMGGAAHVLGLASLIMDAKLPVRLRVLIPAVENAISGNSYRPGDVIATRKGLTVEITNTDDHEKLIHAHSQELDPHDIHYF